MRRAAPSLLAGPTAPGVLTATGVLAVWLLVLVGAAAGCGPAGGRAPDAGSRADAPATSVREPTTPGALAWLAAEHLGDPDSASRADGSTYRLVRGAVGADLRYGAGPGEDGALLSVVVSTGSTEGLACTAEDRVGGGCAPVGGTTLHWRRTVPEQESGSITVYAARAGGTVRVHASLDLRGDPRGAILEPGLADLLALATDDRVGPSTTAEAVTAGARLPWWDAWNGPPGAP